MSIKKLKLVYKKIIKAGLVKVKNNLEPPRQLKLLKIHNEMST